MPDISAPAATAARALLASLVRHALVAAGAALVTRGLVDQGTVDGVLPTIVESIVGTLLVAGATGWAQLRAWLAHGRFAAVWVAIEAQQPPAVATAGIVDRPREDPIGAITPLSPAAAGQADSAGPAA